jgi:hypothetical protein
MLKRFITYTGVTKKWRNKWSYKKRDWGYQYAREILEGVLVIKEYNHGRVINMRERIIKLILFFLF